MDYMQLNRCCNIYIYIQKILKGIENCYPCITDLNYICKENKPEIVFMCLLFIMIDNLDVGSRKIK